jgi:hypothetical protein
MKLVELFYVGVMSVAVLAIPTLLVFMAWYTSERKPAPRKAEPAAAPKEHAAWGAPRTSR